MRRPPQKKAAAEPRKTPLQKAAAGSCRAKKNGCGLRDESSDATSHRFQEEFIRKTTPEGPETAGRRPAYRSAHSLRHITTRTHSGIRGTHSLRHITMRTLSGISRRALTPAYRDRIRSGVPVQFHTPEHTAVDSLRRSAAYVRPAVAVFGIKKDEGRYGPGRLFSGLRSYK